MPILVRARQPTHLQAKDDADMVQTDLRQQVLKAQAPHGRLTAPTLIFIDDFDAILGPAQERGTMHQRVLPISRLAVFHDLLRGRLPDIDDGLSFQVPVFDFGRGDCHDRGRRRPSSCRRRAGLLRMSSSCEHGVNALHASPPSVSRTGDDASPVRSTPGRVAVAGWLPTVPKVGPGESVALFPLETVETGGDTRADVVGHGSPPCDQDWRCWHHCATCNNADTLILGGDAFDVQASA